MPYRSCRHCGGTGAVKTFTCTVCRGKGYLPAPRDPTTTCPDCRGSGDDPSAPALACLTCRGRGWVPAKLEGRDGRGRRSPGAAGTASRSPTISGKE